MRGFVLRILVPLGVVLLGALVTLSIAGAFGGSTGHHSPGTTALDDAAPGSVFATHVQVIPPPKGPSTPATAATPTPATPAAPAVGTTATGTSLPTGTTSPGSPQPAAAHAKAKPLSAAKPKPKVASTVKHTAVADRPAAHATTPASTTHAVEPADRPVVTPVVKPVTTPVVAPVEVAAPSRPAKTSTPPAASATKPSPLAGPPGLQAPGG
jgi:hypothetical protein